ncbi:MAG TPA: hypothetical protein VNJ46_07565 [Gaiellaceae bacterium]|nr:hypothetical protein [Gaiellaceae bacterium]
MQPGAAAGRRRTRLGRAAFLAFLLLVAAGAVGGWRLLSDRAPAPPPLLLPSELVGPDPLAFREGRTEAYERAAAFGLSHPLFTRSPGGAAASARRTARFRPLVEEAAAGSGVDADLLEAIVFLESAGRPDVIAGDDPARASGLTQILAGTAVDFLAMPVDLEASRRLTRGIAAALRRGDRAEAERLRERRRRADARFDPEQALAGTVRYLTRARDTFGRDDLAVASYHMGIGNLASVVRAYAGRPGDPIDQVVEEEEIDYARLYFDSSPARNREAWALLASFGDDSQTYYFRVLAARELMRLFREDPRRLRRLEALHRAGRGSELVFHPPDATERFATAGEIQGALLRGALEELPDASARDRFRVDPALDRLAARLGLPPRALRALRPRALRALRYLARRVYRLSGEERPLAVARAAYDAHTAAALAQADVREGAHASVHATGYAFDVRRRYGSGAQASAFQWTLERLQALGLVSWTRGGAVIHVTVSPRAALRPAR